MTDIPAGWPCATLPDTPPAVADKLSNPAADDLLPQVLALTPRGPAWGTDEAGDGKGASPVMRLFWKALAAWSANVYATDFDLAVQALPSAVSWSLPDWEAEYGLPDPCFSAQAGEAQRRSALRARFGAVGGQSPAYFVCLAKAAGYDVTIEEPTQFFCDDSECDGDDEVSDETVWKYWIVHVAALGETWFYPDDGECDWDPLEGFLYPADLECILRRYCPPHTVLVFDYAG